jgi:hypothetical protein
MRRFSATILQAAVDEFRHTTPGMTAPGTAGKQTAHGSRVEPCRMLWTEHPPGLTPYAAQVNGLTPLQVLGQASPADDAGVTFS